MAVEDRRFRHLVVERSVKSRNKDNDAFFRASHLPSTSLWDHPNGTTMAKSTTKLRGPYAPQACTVCRARKSKCDGVKPTCGSCRGSGRDSECSWGHTSLRRPRTVAHFEALRRRADSLQAYVDMLQALLAKCVCQDISSHLPCPPPSSGDHTGNDASSEDDATHSDEEIAHELTAPAQLQLEEDLNALRLRPIPALPLSSAPPIRLPCCLGMNDNAGLNERPSTSYILLVNGIEESQSHPYIDWSRYLPTEVTLTRNEHDKILDLSFKFLTMWCLRIVPPLFLRDMHRALSVPPSDSPPRTAYYSPALHNVLLALSANFSDDPYIKHLETRLTFASTAKAHLEGEYGRPSPCLVQTLACLGTFYADAGHRVMGDSFYAMSSGVNMALDLGPNAAESVKTGLITHEEMVTQNWAHWSTFSIDVLCALYFRRTLTLPPPDRQSIPLPTVDAEYDQMPWIHPSTNIPPQPNLLTLIFFESAGLLLIAYQIIDVMNTSPSARQDAVQIDERITKIDLELNKWLSRLPPGIDITFMNRAESTPQRLMLHCLYSWCCLVLHRPFFSQRGELQDDHIKASFLQLFSETILELLKTWSEIYTLRLAPLGLVAFVFDAGTIFLLRALHATTGQRIAHTALQTAIEQVETCVRYLKEIGRTWQTAERTAAHLQSMLRDKLQPILDKRIAPNGGRLRPYLRSTSAKSDQNSDSHVDRGGPSPGQYAELPPMKPIPTMNLLATENMPPTFIGGDGYDRGVGLDGLLGFEVEMNHVLFPSVEFFNHHELSELAPTYNFY
ncbi:hypothetical protein C8F04DRAFT_1394007 [Mycena alexandri]|uniref:Zn(2)-C6 fungal-type domain-containing protein n=1 Tax=Mycena alexandri TaxID=1745969 RepID=A0AAD6X4V6_9AGAR|nr:hypothetical protein C8F04DRAFT_1394007 [Mycena alexandri]